MVASRFRSVQNVVVSPLLTRATPVARARKTKAGSYELSQRQADTLHAIRAYRIRHGFAPTRAELGKALNLKHQSAVDNHLHALAKKGWLEVAPGRERGIRLLREGAPCYEPDDFSRGSGMLGIDDEPTREPVWIQCDGLWELLGIKPDLYMRIANDAMDAAGLPEGGIVALRRSYDPTQDLDPRDYDPEDGDVVAARVGDHIELARFKRIDEQTVELTPQSTNPLHEPRRFDTGTHDFEIIGVVIGRAVKGSG